MAQSGTQIKGEKKNGGGRTGHNSKGKVEYLESIKRGMSHNKGGVGEKKCL